MAMWVHKGKFRARGTACPGCGADHRHVRIPEIGEQDPMAVCLRCGHTARLSVFTMPADPDDTVRASVST